MTDWNDFVYRGQREHPQVILRGQENWSEWEANLRQMLQPYAAASTILDGKPYHGDFRDANIDFELYVLLLSSLETEGPIYSTVLDIKDEQGASASKVYKALKAHFGASASKTQGTAYTINPNEGNIESSGECRNCSTVGVQTQEKKDAGQETSSSSKRKRAEDGAKPSLSSLYRRDLCPKLSRATWSKWEAMLHIKVKVIPFAFEILTGAIREGHNDYCAEINSELFGVIESSETGAYHRTINAIEFKHGRKGSKLYVELKTRFGSDDDKWCSVRPHKK